jgi:hypothetical protein
VNNFSREGRGKDVFGGLMMKTVKVIVFDAYGTLFDVHSITQKCNEVIQGATSLT